MPNIDSQKDLTNNMIAHIRRLNYQFTEEELSTWSMETHILALGQTPKGADLTMIEPLIQTLLEKPEKRIISTLIIKHFVIDLFTQALREREKRKGGDI